MSNKNGQTVNSKQKQKTHQEISSSVSGEQVSKQLASSFPFSNFLCFPAFQVVILVEYPVIFILGKCLLDY